MSYRTAHAAATLLGIAALFLAGCSADAGPEAAPETPTPTAQVAEPTLMPTPAPPNCVHEPSGRINLPGYSYNTEEVSAPELSGEISDSGPRESAAGEPTLNDDGQVVSYTVQPGETLNAIAARFCIDATTFAFYNHTQGWDLQPGAVLVLRPTPNEPWTWDL